VLRKLVLNSRLPSNVVGKKDSTGSPSPPVSPPVPEPPPQAPKLFTCIDRWDLIREARVVCQ